MACSRSAAVGSCSFHLRVAIISTVWSILNSGFVLLIVCGSSIWRLLVSVKLCPLSLQCVYIIFHFCVVQLRSLSGIRFAIRLGFSQHSVMGLKSFGLRRSFSPFDSNVLWRKSYTNASQAFWTSIPGILCLTFLCGCMKYYVVYSLPLSVPFPFFVHLALNICLVDLLSCLSFHVYTCSLFVVLFHPCLCAFGFL